MIPLDEARRFVIQACSVLPPRQLSVDDALGCVLSEDVVATEPIPPFANSAMDGYAVRAAETVNAPVQLEVIGSVMAGQVLERTVGEGQAARIMTGAPLPAGADAVSMVEDTETSADGLAVSICRPVRPGQFVRGPGLDVAVGDVVACAGTVLTPAYLGVLVAQGRTTVAAHPRPTVGVLSTGDELHADTGPLPPGKIRDANRPTLMALARKEGLQCVDLGIVSDDESALVEVLGRGAAGCDAVVTSGGVSVGDLDLVKTALEKLSGGTMRWMQVAIKPAKPFAFGVLAGSGKPVFGLPGNPVSAMVSFELFVRPALRLMGGHRSLERPVVAAVCEEDLPRHDDGKLHLLRAKTTLDRAGHWRVHTNEGQESHQLRSLADSNSLVLLPEAVEARAGDQVDVLLTDPARLSFD